MDMSLLGIIVALVVLIIICYRKFNPVVGTLICVAILAIFSGLSVLDTITDTYFTGFSDFLKNNFFAFCNRNRICIYNGRIWSCSSICKNDLF